MVSNSSITTTGGLQVAVLEYRVPDPFRMHRGDPVTVVLGQMVRETRMGQRGEDDVVWKLRLLPDTNYRPDFMLQNEGTFYTEAKTQEQAERVLTRACEALARWIDTNARAKASLEREIVDATSKAGVVQPPLEYPHDDQEAAVAEPVVATLPVTLDVDPDPEPGKPPHSRACGMQEHPHGTACAMDCPTCHGRAAELSGYAHPTMPRPGQ
jgi:hypothetical protein